MTRFRTALAASAGALALSVTPVALGAPGDAPRGCKSFEATLSQHLNAIGDRDLAALEPTVDDSVTLIFPSGRIRDGKEAFMAFHEAWFADLTWRQPVEVIRTNVQGCKTAWVLVDYHYQDLDDAGNVISDSHAMFALTWTFKQGRWVVIADQNTPLAS